MKRQKRRDSGMTLVEVIICMALLGLIMTAAYSVITYGRAYLNKAEEEYEFQFSTRLTLQNSSDIIRYSTAVFTIPESSFSEDNLDSGWDYIGIHEVEITPGVTGNEIVKYTYDEDTDTHIPTVLIPARSDVAYTFLFTKVNPQDEDSLLQFSIESYPVSRTDEYGNPSAAVTITSEVEARNSLQVIDLSSAYDPAVAIAFRKQERTDSVVGHVVMVLDTSGSMADDMDGDPVGYGHGYGGESRISILKEEATTLINEFAQEDNIDLALVPFATSANNIYAFYNTKTETAALLACINNLSAIGGTNTGDGLRRAYWQLKDHNATVSAGVRASNYVIILVDGVTTFASVISDSNRNFVTDDSTVNEGCLDRGWAEYDPDGQIAGNGSNLDEKGTQYVDRIGTSMLDKNSFAKAYVIGFSSISSELSSVNDIASACGAPSERVFTAGSSDDLNQVFEEIRQDIVNDLWYLQGPQL